MRGSASRTLETSRLVTQPIHDSLVVPARAAVVGRRAGADGRCRDGLVDVASDRWRARLRPEIAAPSTTDLTSIAISPDGRTLVVMAEMKSVPHLWVRTLDATSFRMLSGTGERGSPVLVARQPFHRLLRERSAQTRGRCQRLGAGTWSSGCSRGTWNQDDTIVFSAGPGTPLATVSGSGATARC